MSDPFNSIEQGLKEALAHARGKGPATIHQIDIPEPDVQVIRASTGLSQVEFARSTGVKKGTLVNGNTGAAALTDRRASCWR